MDCLTIKNLEVYANHGVFTEEKKLGQKFLITVNLFYNMKKAALYNDLEASVHYGILSQEITEKFKEKNYDLIETSAYKLIEFIFEKYKIVEKVDLEVKKPWAPIGLPLETVKIKISRKKRRYFISIGSNQGDKEKNISQSLERLDNSSCKILKLSKNYITKAWGKTDQEDFLNCAVEIESYEEPEDFLKILNNIEDEMGRVRKEKWGPRLIDLDILFVDDEVIYSESLVVPHPYIEEREFVLEPLAEIAPFFIHPVLNKSVKNLLSDLKK